MGLSLESTMTSDATAVMHKRHHNMVRIKNHS